jgi:hypothetical protein
VSRLSHNSDRDRGRRVSVRVAGSLRYRGTFLAWQHDHKRGFVLFDPRPGRRQATVYAVEGYQINLAHKEREPSPKAYQLDSSRPLLAVID